MLEQSLHELFQQMASAEQPANPITVPQVIRQGRSRRRWQRFGAPGMAALAVLAIALTATALSAGSPGASHQQPPVAAQRSSISHPFSVLSLYAWFGWLPDGESMNPARTEFFGNMYPDLERLVVAPWTLNTFAAGKCHRTGNELNCGYTSNGCGENGRLQAPAPAINGHPAYWAYWDRGSPSGSQGLRCLAWEYKPGGWTYVESDGKANETEQTVLRVARAVTFGARTPLFRFAAQLTGLPGKWRVYSSQFGSVNGALLAGGYEIRDGKSSVDIGVGPPADGPNKCFSNTVCYRINGYYVNLDNISPAYPDLWARNADGLQATVSGTQKQLGLLRTVFTHLKMLGTDPANWTTRLIG